MSSNKNVPVKKYLMPISWIYGLIVCLRNKLFDLNILKQKSFDIPIISVGNITVGGTGKTPHVEYLAKLLSKKYKVAVLSRGYKRKTKGFILSDENSTAIQIGDEPFQIKLKFPKLQVAVDAVRTRGIQKLLAQPKATRPDVILLDDAYQHRYVKPSYSILLTDYNRLITQDTLLPVGRLREPAYYSKYANTIIVTKCPTEINPLEQRITIKEINAYPYQDLLFTTFKYGDLINVFDTNDRVSLEQRRPNAILVVTGIANPTTFHQYLEVYCSNLECLIYSDHYQFNNKDMVDIQYRFEQIKDQDKCIVVTEKDAVRLRSMSDIPDSVKSNLYYIPIEVTFINEEERYLFNTKIINHVRKNKANNRLHKS